MLTQKQELILDYIKSYIADHEGVSPSFDEICKALHISSKGRIHEVLIALEERGHIHRLPNRARAIKIVETATDISRARREAFDQGYQAAMRIFGSAA